MRRSQGWARARLPGAHIMRLGAWYQVLGKTAPNLVVLDIARRNVAIPSDLLQISPHRPERFSVVPRSLSKLSEKTDDSASIYAVCPKSGTRVRLSGHPESIECPSCGHRGAVDWRSLPTRLPPGVEMHTAEMSQEGPRLEFVSLEDGKQERLKFVSLSFASPADCRCRARVVLERQPGQITVASAEGPDSGAGKLRAAAQATLETVRRSVDASPKAFELVGIKAVTVFGEAAVIVAIAFRSDRKEQRMVGFCVIDDDDPPRAAPLAVLNATNRFLGAVLAGKIT